MEKRHSNEFEAIADDILREHALVSINDDVYEYESGVYRKQGSRHIEKYILDYISNVTSHRIREVLNIIKIKTSTDIDEVNKAEYFNFQNGLFNINTRKLKKHSPEVISTIQLPYNYNSDATCPKWEEFLGQVLTNDLIGTIQEFYGLCLTVITEFEKALIKTGEGANGKGVSTYILQKLVGESNFESIPLTKLNNSNYIIKLFGKTVNTFSESPSKLKLAEDMFKAIVSGDMVTGEEKFKQPIKFSPFAKLVIDTNNLPYIDDKSQAVYRRLIIIPFDKVFSEKEQNKKLRYELEQEIEGIFNWALEGLNRLLNRGYFEIPERSRSILEEYRKSNNNVLTFLEEECEFGCDYYSETKDKLYLAYQKWAKKSGYYPLGAKNFNAEVKKDSRVLNKRNAKNRPWSNIRLRDRYKYQ